MVEPPQWFYLYFICLVWLLRFLIGLREKSSTVTWNPLSWLSISFAPQSRLTWVGFWRQLLVLRLKKSERTDLFAFQLKVHVDGVVCVVVCLRVSTLQQQMQFLVQPLQTVAQYTGRLLWKDWRMQVESRFSPKKLLNLLMTARAFNKASWIIFWNKHNWWKQFYMAYLRSFGQLSLSLTQKQNIHVWGAYKAP